MQKGKYETKRTPVANVAIWTAIVLFWLVIITTYMSAGLFARYSTQGAGSDSARVIAFGDLSLTETGDFYEDGKLMIIPGVNLQKKAVVNFGGSESATYVFVAVTPVGWTTVNNETFTVFQGDKLAMQWNVAEEWTFLDADAGTYVYYQEISPNQQLTADIFATLPGDKDAQISVSDAITRHEIAGLTDISITLRAAVVQSGGFADAGAARASLAAKEGSV